ncbi:hypothetical protein ACH437_15120 [Streptomyces xinghaiensis]|uniref:hypothetical protein n=1 Tax=Streptomyces xinghaiensis TaxID=1038928 RepID=UPI0037B4A9C9
MTATRDALADLLTEAAQQVASVLTAQGPAIGTSARPYLAPFLGPLAAAPPVLHSLSEQLDAYFSDPLPKTPAGLFTLACLAAANGQLNDLYQGQRLSLTAQGETVLAEWHHRASPRAETARTR